VAGGAVRGDRLDPAAFGFERATVEDLSGGDADASAAIVRAILAGDQGPKRDIVLLNAGAALSVAGAAETIERGIELAAGAIDSGAASAKLERWVAVSQNG
jgi:anthranilate phosphoribosyltransferase